MGNKITDYDIPDYVWDHDELTHIHATVLFADFGSSEFMATTVSPRRYNSLLNNFQQVMLDETEQLKADGFPVAEVRVFGDELCLMFYDPDEVIDNFLLDFQPDLDKEEKKGIIARRRQKNENLIYHALGAAIRLKNAWLVSDPNINRLKEHLPPLDLSVGLNYGWTYYCKRSDGENRIEGYPISMAKRIERHARAGKVSKIVVSRLFYNTLRQSIRKHTQLKQRIFDTFTSSSDSNAETAESPELHELKFYHRIGVKSSPLLIKQYEALFALDNANLWAYHQLMEHYAYQSRNWALAYEIAKQANTVHPDDEKILLDIARYYLHNDRHEQSKEFARYALEKNPSFDLAHELLAQLAALTNDDEMQLHHFRQAAMLSPGSAVNNFNLGLALFNVGREEEGYKFVMEALRIFPEYSELQEFRETLSSLKKEGKLPDILIEFLEPSMGE